MRAKGRFGAPWLNWSLGILMEVGVAAGLLALGAAISFLIARGGG